MNTLRRPRKQPELTLAMADVTWLSKYGGPNEDVAKARRELERGRSTMFEPEVLSQIRRARLRAVPPRKRRGKRKPKRFREIPSGLHLGDRGRRVG